MKALIFDRLFFYFSQVTFIENNDLLFFIKFNLETRFQFRFAACKVN